MAKKKKKSKLNRSLLLYIVLGAAVAGGGAFGAYRYIRSSDNAGELKKALAAYEAKDWETARKSFDRYTQREAGKTDAVARLKYIDVLSRLTSFDEKNMLAMFQVNEHALQIDLSNKAALESFIRLTFDFAEGRGAIRSQEMAGTFRYALDRIKDFSASLLRIDPQSRLGAEATGLAEMIALSKRATNRNLDDLEAARKVIDAQLEKHKYSPRLLNNRLQIVSNMVSELAESGVRVNADYAEAPVGPLLQRVRADLPDLIAVATTGAPAPSADGAAAAPIADLSNNDRVELLRTAVYTRRLLLSLSGESAKPEELAEASKEIQALVEKAGELAKPGDLSFVATLDFVADTLRQQGRLADAEATLKRIVEASPDVWTGRILLADFYRSIERHKDALAQLNVDLKPSYDRIGTAGALFIAESTDATVRRAELRARNWSSVAESERAAERKRIEEERALAARLLGELNPRVKLIDVAVKRNIDRDLVMTQELLRQTRAEIPSASQQPDDVALADQVDLESVEVAILRGQTGTARDLLTARLKEGRRNQLMMLRLVDVYVRERNFAEARNLLKPLAEGGKDNPVFQEAWIIANADQPVVTKQLLDQLPQATPAERARKFRLAVGVNQPDVYGPLLEGVVAESGSDAAVLPVIQQAFVNMRTTEAEKARVDAMIESAIKKYPDVQLYGELRRVFSLVTPEDIEKITLEEIEKLTDPYSKAIAFARYYASRGQSEEALAQLQEAVKLDPEAKRGGDAQTMLFQVYAGQGKFDDASKLVDVLASANTDRAGGRIWRARLLLQQGKNEEALALAKQVQTELPDYTAAWVTVGMAQAASGQLQESLRTVDVALSQTPQDLEALRLGISAARALGRRDDIEKYVSQARQRYPRALEFELVQLDTTAQFGDPETTVVRREALAQQNPKSAEFQYQLGRAYALVARKYAFARKDNESMSWVDKAIAVNKAAIEQFPTDLRFLGDYATLTATVKNDPEAGLKAFEAARAKSELAGNVELEMKYGSFLFGINRPADARKVFEPLAEKNPKNRAVIEAIAQTYLAEGSTDNAIKALQRLGDSDADALFAQADVLARADRKAEALALVEKVVTLSNNAPRARARQAELLIDLGRVDEARSIAESIVARDPRDATGRFLRALIELRSAKPDLVKAIEDLEAVRAANANNVIARAQLADLYAATGRQQDAGEEIEATYRANKADRVAILRVLGWYAANKRWQNMLNVIDDARQTPQLTNDPEIMLNESAAYDGLSDGPKAIATAKKLFEALPSNDLSADAYTATLAKYGTFQELEREAQKILKDRPAAWRVKLNLARAYANQNKRSEAFAQLRDAFNTQGLNQPQQAAIVLTVDQLVGTNEAISMIEPLIAGSDIWAIEGVRLYQKVGNMEKAGELVRRLEAKAPAWGDIAQRRRIYTLAAEFYLLSEPPQTQKAVDAYGRLLELGQLDKMALNNYADALTRLGDPASNVKALQMAEQAFQAAKAGQFAAPEDAYIMDTYGWCLVLNDRTEDGIPILSDALDRANLPESCYHLAEAYLRKNNPEIAKSFAQKGLDIIAKQKQNGLRVDEALLRRMQDAMQRASK